MNSKYRYLIAITLTLSLGGCAVISEESVTAQVVDADTGQPLAGADVVIFWSFINAGPGDFGPCGTPIVEEAVTDNTGHFRFAGMAPTVSSCEIPQGAPGLYFFKPGYLSLRRANWASDNPLNQGRWIGRSDFDRATIQLKALKNIDSDRYSGEIDLFDEVLEGILIGNPTSCDWKKVPNFLRDVIVQEKQFHETRYNTILAKLVDADAALQLKAPECGSPKAFIAGLEK